MAKYKALLIDDNTQFTESVKGYLLSQDRFSEVDTAQDGREALKKLREKTYDVMTLDLKQVTAGLRKPFAVVANIPYYITTPLIRLLLESGLEISRLALMVQQEVADKILAEPGDEAWCPLSVLCRFLCEPELAVKVPAEMFTPPPKVDSAFVVLPLREKPAVDVKDREMFFRVANAAFALRRKTMVNNLCATFRAERSQALEWLQAAGLDEKIRGEKLTLEEIAALADAIDR